MKIFVFTLMFFTLIGCVEQIDIEEINSESFSEADVAFCVGADCKDTDSLIIQFKVSTLDSVEGGKQIIELVANKEAPENIPINLMISAESNVDSNDYSLPSLSMMLLKGQKSVQTEVSFVKDSLVENSEQLILGILSVGQGLIGNRAKLLINIANGAVPPPVVKPNVSFAFNSYEVSEGAKNVIVPVSLSQLSTRDININFSSNRSSEIEINPQILTIPAGTLSREVTINFQDNENIDGNRELVLSLASQEGTIDPVKGQAVFKIIDNDIEKPPGMDNGGSNQVNGLFAEYWNNQTLSGTPVKTEIVDMVNNNFGAGSPDPMINNNGFSIRYSGQIYIQNPGSYTFHTTSDDGVRLWIDDQLVIDRWVDQGASTYSATLMFSGQSSHKVKIEYYENAGDAVMQFRWTQNNQIVAVPKSVLYATDSAVVFEELAFLSPANNDRISSEFTVSASCYSGSSVTLSGDLVSPVTQNCLNGKFNASAIVSGGEGIKNLNLSQTHNGQNYSDSISVTVDNAAPSLEILSPGQYTKVNQMVTITGKCETDVALSIIGVGVRYPLKSVCTFGEFSRTVSLTPGDGLKTIIVNQQDDAGNKTELSLIVENKEELLADNGGGNSNVVNVSFNEAKAVLNTYCIGCHKAGGQASSWNFDYDQEEDFIKNNYVVAGDPAVSKLIQRTKYSEGTNDNMPLGILHNSFTPEDFQILYNWVASMNNVEIKIEPFTVNKNIHRLLGFNERMSKLDYLFGANVVNSNRAEFLANRYELGDFNYAQGVTPNLDWNSTRILLWQKLVEPICTSDAAANQFNGAAGMAQFVEKAYGRKMETPESAMISELQSSGLNSKDQFGVLCLAIATSGEFVSK